MSQSSDRCSIFFSSPPNLVCQVACDMLLVSKASGGATLSWVLVVDGSKAVVSALADLEMAGPVPPSTADIQMAFLTVLGTRFLQCSALLQGPSL